MLLTYHKNKNKWLNTSFYVIQFGYKLGSIILAMINSGLDVDKLHLVGHSLGGQLAGFAGRTVISLSDKKIKLKRYFALVLFFLRKEVFINPPYHWF